MPEGSSAGSASDEAVGGAEIEPEVSDDCDLTEQDNVTPVQRHRPVITAIRVVVFRTEARRRHRADQLRAIPEDSTIL